MKANAPQEMIKLIPSLCWNRKDAKNAKKII